MLRDKEIRTALVDHLMKRSPKPARVLEELTIDNGNAIADVVACYREMHCYEIKGQTDNVRRLLSQSEYYSQSFPKLTLVTTENHLKWAATHAPEHWGLILAKEQNNRVVLSYVRKAGTNSNFCKHRALLMLWKTELAAIATAHPQVAMKKSFTRADIAAAISAGVTRDDALSGIQSAILSRSSNGVHNERDMSGS
ncbi:MULTISPECIES: sce7726 family protein [Pseudomonas putida group]|uniref:sce7726 family protein n=1 Tax=Pseudomonas putida group TaxID=136845 RepID=UPI0009B7FE0A|nr:MULTISPECIES: sce7726 family protein [Pseudomonas putida group]QKL09281.1 sce7726 family protein [Pseudomonas putida]